MTLFSFFWSHHNREPHVWLKFPEPALSLPKGGNHGRVCPVPSDSKIEVRAKVSFEIR